MFLTVRSPPTLVFLSVDLHSFTCRPAFGPPTSCLWPRTPPALVRHCCWIGSHEASGWISRTRKPEMVWARERRSQPLPTTVPPFFHVWARLGALSLGLWEACAYASNKALSVLFDLTEHWRQQRSLKPHANSICFGRRSVRTYICSVPTKPAPKGHKDVHANRPLSASAIIVGLVDYCLRDLTSFCAAAKLCGRPRVFSPLYSCCWGPWPRHSSIQVSLCLRYTSSS